MNALEAISRRRPATAGRARTQPLAAGEA